MAVVSWLSNDNEVTKNKIRDDNIAPIELNASSASKTYTVGKRFVLDSDGKLYKATQQINQGSAIITSGANANCEEVTEKVLDNLGTASTKNSTSVVTDSTDLVESGAVKDIVGWGNKNLLPNNEVSQSVNGVTFSVQDDKSVIANGTATTNWTRFYFAPNTHLPVGDYLLSGATGGGILSYRLELELSNGDIVTVYDGEVSFGITQGLYIIRAFITIRSAGYVANNVVFKPMIRKADVTDATYEPFHVSVEQTLRDAEVIEGKNKINYPYPSTSGLYNGVTITENKGAITVSGTATQRVVFYIADNLSNYDLPNGDYIASVENIPQSCGMMIEGYNNTTWIKQLAQLIPTNPSINFTVDHDGYNKIKSYIYINSGATVNATIKPMIRKATEDATYEPPYTPLKDVVPTKADNSVIGTVEDGATASQAYAVRSHFIRDGKFQTVNTAITQGEPLVGSNKFTSGDVASLLSVDTSGRIIAHDSNVTVDSSTVLKSGNVVCAKFTFTLTNAITSDANTQIADISIPPYDNYLPLATLIKSGIPYNPIDCVAWIGAAGNINLRANLEAGTYQAYITYICK